MLNHLLRNSAVLRITFLVNDFGEINIDAELIESAVDRYVGDTVPRQLRSADLLIVNKSEFIEPNEPAAVGD